jgi:hypothetical protein
MKYRRSQIREAWAVLEAQDVNQWPNWPREVFEKARMIDEDEAEEIRVLEWARKEYRARRASL